MNHGGKRFNAGRKTELPGERMAKHQVTLDEMTVRKLKAVGDGNLSAGIRVAAKVAYDRFQAER